MHFPFIIETKVLIMHIGNQVPDPKMSLKINSFPGPVHLEMSRPVAKGAMGRWIFSPLILFSPLSFEWAFGREDGWTVVATLSVLDLCKSKLEDIKRCSYHGPTMVWCNVMARPLTLTLSPETYSPGAR